MADMLIGPDGRPREPVWTAIRGTSQELAVNTRCNVTLYAGARGPGKTDTQLMHFKQYVGKGYGPFWRGIIFDREYKMLDDIVSKSKRWFPMYEDGAKFLESKSDYKWKWPGGEELLVRSIKEESDYWNYHGQEFPWIGWNELCKYPTLALFDKMMSCNRSSFTPDKDAPLDENGKRIVLPPIPLRVFATTNPFGPGHSAVRKRFIDVAPYGDVVRTRIEVFDPRTKENVIVERTQVTIFGSWRENIYLDPVYLATLVSEKDPNIRAAWAEGRWDIVSGGAFDDLWTYDVHVLPRFRIPAGWFINRSLDWGSTHPYSVGFWAESNGEEIELPDGSKISFPPGTLIKFAELYGCDYDKIGSNKGRRESAKEIAAKINEFEELLMLNGWIAERPQPGPADNQIRDVRESDVDTIEKKFSDAGIIWLDSDKSRGSRKMGLQLMRERLEASKSREGPGLYFMRNCRASIETVPHLPRSEKIPDDVDTDAEDHAYDMARYRVLQGNSRLALDVQMRIAC